MRVTWSVWIPAEATAGCSKNELREFREFHWVLTSQGFTFNVQRAAHCCLTLSEKCGV